VPPVIILAGARLLSALATEEELRHWQDMRGSGMGWWASGCRGD